MKKLLAALALIAMLSLASCNKEEVTTEENVETPVMDETNSDEVAPIVEDTTVETVETPVVEDTTVETSVMEETASGEVIAE